VAVLLEEVFCGDHTARSLRKNRAPTEAAGRFGVVSVPQLVQRLDIKEEVLETLLSYIEVWPSALRQHMTTTDIWPRSSADLDLLFWIVLPSSR
jgi:hypothetical protein